MNSQSDELDTITIADELRVSSHMTKSQQSIESNTMYSKSMYYLALENWDYKSKKITMCLLKPKSQSRYYPPKMSCEL